MTEAPLTDPVLAALAGRLDMLTRRTHAAVAPLEPGLFAARPPGGGWSPAEVFEHLCVTSAAYDRPIDAATAKARNERARGRAPRAWRASFIGGLLAGALAEKHAGRKLPSPAPFRPGAPRANVVAAFLGTLARTRAAMHAADGLDLRTGLASPISPLIRMNLGDAFTVIVTHGERHLAQAERTARSLRG